MKFKLNGIETTADGIVFDVSEVVAPDPQPEPDPPTPDPVDPPPPLPTGTAYLWRPERIAVFDRIKAENHPDYQAAMAWGQNADPAKNWGMLLYLVTRDQKYFQTAYDQRLGSPLSVDENNVSHGSGIDWPLEYQLLRPAMSAEQEAWARKHLTDVCDGVLARGVRLNDSDHCLGAFGLLCLTDQILGTKYLDDPRVGGLDPGEFTTATNMRQAIAWFARLGEGGEWPESSDYNSDSDTLVALFHDAMLQLRGEERFPELARYKASARVAGAMRLTPDLKSLYQWGDIEKPRDMHLYTRLGQMAALGAHDVVRELRAKHPSVRPYVRYFYFNDPYSETVTAKPDRWLAKGQRIAYAKDADSLFATQFTPPFAVDHNYVDVQGNFSLYHDGEWLIDNAKAYTADNSCFNICLFRGIGAGTQHHPTETFTGPGWYAVRGGTFGNFIRDHKRTVVWLDGIGLVVRDEIDAVDPLKDPALLAQFTSYHNWPGTAVEVQDGKLIVNAPVSAWTQQPYIVVAKGQVAKVTGYEALGARSLLTYAPPLDIKTGDAVTFRGGGQLGALLAAPAVVEWQCHVSGNAQLTDDGCAYSVGEHLIRVRRFGAGLSGRFALQPWAAPQNRAKRYVTDGPEGNYTMTHVITLGDLPATVSDDDVMVGGMTVAFGETVEVQ